jgi:hypothetical protein
VIITSAPFVAALSLQKGRFTLGETGRLNYGWEVLGAARSTHWQGEPFNIGRPKHPTTRVFSSPATYLFPLPVAGTYPPWYDPSYWYEGIAPRLDVFRQLVVFRMNLNYALLQTFITPGIVVLLILALGNIVPRWLAIDAVVRYGFLLLPNAAAILMYCLVFVDRRYISGFLAVLAMTLWAAVYEQFGHRRGPTAAVIGSAVLTVAILLSEPNVVGFDTLRWDARREKPAANPQWEIAGRAERTGMRPGERVGYIGLAISADWLRLKQHRVVGEITVIYDRDVWPARRVTLNQSEIAKFWRADKVSQEAIFEEFRRAGARWVAADYVPPWADTCGWSLVGGKGVDSTYIRPLTDQVLRSPVTRESAAGQCDERE